jgi:hypothetical protein
VQLIYTETASVTSRQRQKRTGGGKRRGNKTNVVVNHRNSRGLGPYEVQRGPFLGFLLRSKRGGKKKKKKKTEGEGEGRGRLLVLDESYSSVDEFRSVKADTESWRGNTDFASMESSKRQLGGMAVNGCSSSWLAVGRRIGSLNIRHQPFPFTRPSRSLTALTP